MQTIINSDCITDNNDKHFQSTDIAFNPAECLLASASQDRIIRFWDADTGECVTQSVPFGSAIDRIHFPQDGKYLLSTTASKITAVAWEPFEIVFQVSKTHDFTNNSTIKTLDFVSDENYLLQLTLEKPNNGDGCLVELTSFHLPVSFCCPLNIYFYLYI